MDERLPDKVVIVKCGVQPQEKSRILHIFKAGQFRRKVRPGRRDIFPRATVNDAAFWESFYRVRLDGRWLSESGCRYHFYSNDELAILVGSLVGGTR